MKIKIKFDIESFSLDKVLKEIKEVHKEKKRSKKSKEVDPSKIFKE